MNKKSDKISLGFTNQKFKPGIHICQVFNDEIERQDALVNFIITGLQNDEKTACFSEKESEKTLASFFEEKGLIYKERVRTGDFTISKTGEAYFTDNKFEPEQMINLLREFFETSQKEKHSGARVIGEMTPDIEHIEGGSKLLEYESKVNMLVKEHPINAVCQYDARAFDGSTILDILKVHPYMIVRGNVVQNPFYERPEDFLSKNNSDD